MHISVRGSFLDADFPATGSKLHACSQDVADVDEIECLRTGMKSDWRSIKAFNKDRFEEKQDRLSEIRDDLETAGLYSEALSKAISANYNRRDRDLPDLSIELEFEIDG